MKSVFGLSMDTSPWNVHSAGESRLMLHCTKGAIIRGYIGRNASGKLLKLLRCTNAVQAMEVIDPAGDLFSGVVTTQAARAQAGAHLEPEVIAALERVLAREGASIIANSAFSLARLAPQFARGVQDDTSPAFEPRTSTGQLESIPRSYVHD